jgi:ATP-dependent Clp protease ATP-binding subunit ClpC
MFDRFTDSARRVILLAEEEARALGHAYLGTEHLLLGALTVSKDTAPGNETEPFDISKAEVRKVTRQLVPGRSIPSSEHIPFTDRAKRVLERSLREAVQARHNLVAPGHILLGTISDEQSVAVQVLTAMGTDIERFRARILESLPAADHPQRSEAAQPFDLISRLTQLERQVNRLTAQVADLQRRLDGRD